jgi:ferredoxin-NADP reductase
MNSGRRRILWDVDARERICLVLESSPYPPGRGSDVYLCGTCGVILAIRLAGAALGSTAIHCQNCGTCNHAESEWLSSPPVWLSTLPPRP